MATAALGGTYLLSEEGAEQLAAIDESSALSSDFRSRLVTYEACGDLLNRLNTRLQGR